MKRMKLVIDIDEYTYNDIEKGKVYTSVRDVPQESVLAIANGTPLDTVLDKIRTEILEEKEYACADFEQYKVDYLGVDAEYVEDELPQDDFRYGMERAIEIIDKYKAESEEE